MSREYGGHYKKYEYEVVSSVAIITIIKWTQQAKLKSWTRLFAFHFVLKPLRKTWIQLFSHIYEVMVRQTVFFSLVMAISLRDEKIWIQNRYNLFKNCFIQLVAEEFGKYTQEIWWYTLTLHQKKSFRGASTNGKRYNFEEN